MIPWELSASALTQEVDEADLFVLLPVAGYRQTTPSLGGGMAGLTAKVRP